MRVNNLLKGESHAEGLMIAQYVNMLCVKTSRLWAIKKQKTLLIRFLWFPCARQSWQKCTLLLHQHFSNILFSINNQNVELKEACKNPIQHIISNESKHPKISFYRCMLRRGYIVCSVDAHLNINQWCRIP